MLTIVPTAVAPASHYLATVTVKMINLDTEQECERTICASNVRMAANVPLDWEGQVLGTVAEQRRLLVDWVADRACEQHNAWMSLVDWKLNYLPIAA